MAGTYETVQGDTWDKIAYQVYGDEKYAGYLMENNRLLLEYLVFPGGVTLATPELADGCQSFIGRISVGRAAE